MSKQTYIFDEDSQTFIPVTTDKEALSYAEQLAKEAEKAKADKEKLYRGQYL